MHRPTLALSICGLALACAVPSLSSAALDPTTFAVVQAEAIPIAKNKATVVKDKRASSKRVVRMARRASLTVGVTGDVQSVTVRVRGVRCYGAPRMRVRVNGKVVSTRAVKNRGWKNLRWNVKKNAANQYQVSLAFTNPRKARTCRRQLRVDWIGVRSRRAAGAPPKVTTLGEGSSTVAVVDQAPFRPDSPEATGAVAAEPPVATATPTPAPAPAPTPVPTPAPPFGTPVTATATKTTSGISRLYASPDSKAAKTAAAWRSSRPGDARQMDKLASSATAVWLGGWTGELNGLSATLKAAAAQKARVPIVIYGIPNRDSGQYSAGGHATAAEYRAWIDSVARTIAKAPSLVVVEPDSTAASMSSAEQAERFGMLSYAVGKFAALSDTLVYLDAGNSSWRTPAEMIWRLKAAGIDKADGFASNVSNFRFTNAEISWGAQISAGLGGKHMVIDTSRNGRGPLPGATGEASWCNPPNRGIGSRSTLATGVQGVDAFVWFKTPGSSDGSCYGHPGAGTYEPEVALALAKNGIW